jgi:phage terminase small subunit
MKNLTPKQEKFCHKYLECGNASEAYRHAYNCEKMADKTVWEKASALLNGGKVAARVDELRADLRAKADITKEEVLRLLTDIARTDATDCVNVLTREVEVSQSEEEIANGIPPRTRLAQLVEIKDTDQLTPSQRRSIKCIKQGRNGIEIEMYSKLDAIKRISEMLGFDAPVKVAQTDASGKDLNKPLTPERRREILKEMGE